LGDKQRDKEPPEQRKAPHLQHRDRSLSRTVPKRPQARSTTPFSIMNQTELDDIDAKIIELAEQNGRISNRDLADAIGISERQAGSRFRRLLESDSLRCVTVVDVYKAGFPITIAIGVQVAQASADEVAIVLAGFPEVIFVHVMSGPYDIEILLIAKDHDGLVTFMKNHLSRVHGIRSFSPSLHIDFFTLKTPPGHFMPGADHAHALLASAALDEVEKGIITHLWKNARATNQEIGKSLGLSEAAVRKRMAQLGSRGIIRTTAVRNIGVNNSTFVQIGIELTGIQYEDAVVCELGSIDQILYTASVLGRYNIISTVYFEGQQLPQSLADRISHIPGVQKATFAQTLRIVKFDYRWGIVFQP
jgi:Lrp/AsnC family transcriptional regulator, leucine-responsive regulatory protein